jgi:hypothetical protein
MCLARKNCLSYSLLDQRSKQKTPISWYMIKNFQLKSKVLIFQEFSVQMGDFNISRQGINIYGYTEPPLRIYSSTTNARCSPRHAIATTANRTYTAIDRYTLCRRIPTTTHTAPSPNTGGLFARPCITAIFVTVTNVVCELVQLLLYAFEAHIIYFCMKKMVPNMWSIASTEV